ncbi:MAG TPA: ABC transporter ATP-binding protein [Candidatus Limnocylindrales bacterium]|nr:ABC transporter ATP-binding protein [Candidatus Limnocylindrales bacterium]
MTTATGRPIRRRRSGHAADASSSSAPIRTRALTKRYGERIAVDTLDLEVRAGEIFGLLGQNGAGKTTTILMLLGLTEPSGGSARVVGLDPSRHPLEVKRRVGYLPDSVGFYGNMTGRENLRYTARLNGLDRGEAEEHIDLVLDQVGLADRADGRTDTYSRGMLQRLGIADALLKDPDVLILDEPTASIDPIGVVEILELLRRLVRERGMTVLLSSHLLDQVQHICDRVGIFADGRLIGVGTVGELAGTFGDGAAHLEATFADGGADPSAALRRVEGVEAAELDPDTGTWRLVVRPIDASARVREAIVDAAASGGLRLTSLRELEPSLEDIYRAAVAGLGSRAVREEVVA